MLYCLQFHSNLKPEQGSIYTKWKRNFSTNNAVITEVISLLLNVNATFINQYQDNSTNTKNFYVHNSGMLVCIYIKNLNNPNIQNTCFYEKVTDLQLINNAFN